MTMLPRFARVLPALILAAVVPAVGPAVAQSIPPSIPPLTLDLARSGMTNPKARQITVTLTRGVRSERDLRDRRLKAAHRQMIAGQAVSTDALRALADAGDGIAALRLIRQLEVEGHTAAPENLAHYYGVAASTGRIEGLFGLVRVLERVDPAVTSPARLRLLQRIVLAYAKAGNPVAAAAMMRFHLAARPFGAMPDEIARLARGAKGKGSPVIALQLAGDLIQTRWDDPAALSEAQSYLQTAATNSTSVRIQLIAQNFLPVLDARIQTLATATQATAPQGTEPNG